MESLFLWKCLSQYLQLKTLHYVIRVGFTFFLYVCEVPHGVFPLLQSSIADLSMLSAVFLCFCALKISVVLGKMVIFC